MKFIKAFRELGINDVALVGGKNASLGELVGKLTSFGINTPDGFAITADAYKALLEENDAFSHLTHILSGLDRKNYSNLADIGNQARTVLQQCNMSDELCEEILESYKNLGKGQKLSVAVRSSATAEDLPNASFAGQHESYLNIRGKESLLHAVKKCFVSLFTDRAIKYREDNGFDHMKVYLSVGVQRMVRSDLACSGVAFTLEPESGNQNVILIQGGWGLGENIVQGTITPDEFYLFKTAIANGKRPIINRKLGDKEKTMICGNEGSNTLINTTTPEDKRKAFVLSEPEIEKLGRWCLQLEEHYKKPVDIEWAKDGQTQELYIVQVRPETVHGIQKAHTLTEYKLREKGNQLAKGQAVGSKIISGKVRLLSSPKEIDKLQKGDILLTDLTSPDWDPVMQKVSGIITNKGGRTSHAAIVARELGVCAVVGTINGTEKIADGSDVTISCAEGDTGFIYEGKLPWEEELINLDNISLPETKAMLIVSDPGTAYKLSMYPNDGVGLMRMEFAINNHIRIHPMALARYNEVTDKEAIEKIEKLAGGYADKKKYFIEKLSQAVATVAAAFYPKDVIVRMSDLKSNEYSNLIGGKQFEPVEENPMIGFRGASRYYNERYKDGFLLECEAMKVVRNEMGLTNVKLMIPFCRTLEEGRQVVGLMEASGLKRGDNGLEIYVMAEIPSNVILAEEFAKIFDGFSIGSNDLTQLTLGIDRDSGIVAGQFDERNEAVLRLIEMVITKALASGSKIGLCGQAPSDHPDFASFLISHGINSISFNPDALLKGINIMCQAEAELQHAKKEAYA